MTPDFDVVIIGARVAGLTYGCLLLVKRNLEGQRKIRR
jgi:flavin-dependent dehydrogenase